MSIKALSPWAVADGGNRTSSRFCYYRIWAPRLPSSVLAFDKLMKGTRSHAPSNRIPAPTAIAGVALALVMAVTGIIAPVLAPHDSNAVSLSARFVPPGGNAVDGQSHILGTDRLGRDVLSRIVTSFRTNLYIGLLGTLLGLLAAWLLVIVRCIRSAGLTQNMPRPLLGVTFYGLAILTYFIGVFLSITIAASVGSSLEAAIVCSGVFSALLLMALVYGSLRGDRASSCPVRLAVRRGIALSPIGFC